jgi:apolipoprotein N-acyltransferase
MKSEFTGVLPRSDVIARLRLSATEAVIGYAHAIEELPSGRRRGLALACGLAVTASLPPLHLLPLLVPAFTALVWLCNGSCNNKAPWRSAFAVGWWFGFGSFITGLYWIAEALLIDPGRFGWMMPFAVFGLPAVLAVFPAGVTLLLYVTGIRGMAQILLFAVLWTAMEWARGHVLTGFPWNLVG